MAGSNGNRHVLRPAEWRAIMAGDHGPWCLCTVDQAQMHPGGGPLVVTVAPDGPDIDITDKVEAGNPLGISIPASKCMTATR